MCSVVNRLADYGMQLHRWNLFNKRNLQVDIVSKRKELAKISMEDDVIDWNNVERVLSTVEARLPLHMKDFLDSAFSVEDVREAMFQMDPFKSPGVDDNAMVGFECIHALRRKLNGKKKGFMSLKLDISKAYDSVEWCFLEGMMRRIGFSKNWISKVTNCVSSVTMEWQISSSCKKVLAKALDMGIIDYHDSYLGLPCVAGRRKLLRKWSAMDSLKLQDGSWDDVLVRQSFSKEEAKAILSLPSSRIGLNDSLLWHFDKSETLLHALWRCSSLKSVRSCSGVGRDGKVLDSLSFLDFVLYCRDIYGIHRLEFLCVTWWRIWFRRNRWVHSRSLMDEACILNWAEVFIQDFQAANRRDGDPLAPRMPSKWLVPPVGVFKINTDVALREQGKVSRIGVVIRDWNSLVMASLCQNIRGRLQPQVIEVVTILCGLQLTMETSLVPASLVSAALSVVKAIDLKLTSDAKVGVVVHDILCVLRNANFRPVSFIP
ncbi:hypothetical protein Ddye_022238 [Dipteronia dyeriana]|uniref:RNase H type-1 domain-containing protein n=1 Tax=Dipteronia dyeriana TaxID=168575 RepID=A0AAD9WYA0_9ROSI|nr:hypothetical protein Ddye_022238 [Dipteronia dyeriana]